MKFNSLVELTEYYRESSISNSYDVRLTHTPGIKNVGNQKLKLLLLIIKDKLLLFDTHLCILDTAGSRYV